ncbi:hypothetical protein [Novipirellula galeiformis]|nr:hypothetical protein [Novipirellula galeiformis]
MGHPFAMGLACLQWDLPAPLFRRGGFDPQRSGLAYLGDRAIRRM